MWNEDDPDLELPAAGYERGVPVPDLTALPRDEWARALAPLERSLRRQLIWNALPNDPAGRAEITSAVYDHEFGDARRGEGASSAAAASRPVASSAYEQPERRSLRQVNIKLTAREHADLSAAADLVGLKPTQLARQLVMNGVRRMHYDERRMSSSS